MKGLQGKTEFGDYLTAIQRKTLGHLAEIEHEDADRCAECGGEDCICCEYYHDRQKWKSPEELEELFAYVLGDDYDYCRYEDEEDEE